MRGLGTILFSAGMLLSASAIISGCSKDDKDSVPEIVKYDKAKQTVIFYMVAENELNRNLLGDIGEILKKTPAIPDSCQIVLFIDDVGKPRIYRFDNHTSETNLSKHQPVYEYEDDFNSCDGENFSRVLQYIANNFDSETYGLVMCSHGMGWLPSTFNGDYSNASAKSRYHKTFGVDNGYNYTSNIGNQMEIPELASALEGFPHLSFIMFDACYMQNIEVAYELRQQADYIIGSPAEVPANGAPFETILPMMFSTPFVPDSIISAYYNEYARWDGYGIALSSISCAYMDTFASETRRFAALHKEYATAERLNKARTMYYLNTKISKLDNSRVAFYDLQDFMRTILLDNEYEQWVKYLDRLSGKSYVANHIYSDTYEDIDLDADRCCGITISLPPDTLTASKRVVTAYDALEWKLW